MVLGRWRTFDLVSVARWLVATPLWLLLWVVSAAASPVEAARDYGCKTPIRIAAFEFGAWYHDGQGISPDLVAVLGKVTGCEFEYVPVPRLEAWAALGRGEIDMIPNSIRAGGRDKVARFVQFLRIRNLMIVRRDLPDAPDTLDGFVATRDMRFGILAGFYYGSYFDYRLHSLLGEDRIVTAAEPGLLFDMLRRREIEVVLAPVTNFFHFVPDMERQTQFRVIDTTQQLPPVSGFAFSREKFSGQQVDNWMRRIDEMQSSGMLQQIIERHLPPRLVDSVLAR